MRAKELGQYLKLSGLTIYRLALEGELPGSKIRDSWRFDMNEVVNMIKNRKNRDGHNGKFDDALKR